MNTRRAWVYPLEDYEPLHPIILDFENPVEPTIQNADDIFQYARKKFNLNSRGYTLLVAGRTFHLKRLDGKGKKNFKIFQLGEDVQNGTASEDKPEGTEDVQPGETA